MSVNLKLDEWLEAAHNIAASDPKECGWFALLQSEAESFVQGLAERVAAKAGVACGVASFEGMAFAGLCCPVRPVTDGQELPQVFWGLDDGGIEDDEWTLPKGVDIVGDQVRDRRK